MPRRRAIICTLALVLTFAAGADLRAQSGRVIPTPTPAPDRDDQIKVFTEEVRIPVFARDQYGHFDPTLEVNDVLVLEDGQPQQVRSIRRIPASVLLVLNTGGELNPGLRSKTTRAMALQLVESLREGDSVAVLQFNRKVELIQTWTTDLAAVRHALPEFGRAPRRSSDARGAALRHAAAGQPPRRARDRRGGDAGR